jgi:uncharacterized surface protein with fasciclin (FAS1) repeats
MKKTLIALALTMGAATAAFAQDIVDVAVKAGSFKTLATALQAAGLVDTLKGPGPFTVFAPTDEAFAKVPKDQLDALLKDKAALTKVLTYHVVPGKVMAKDVKAGQVKTVNGAMLTVKTEGDGGRRQSHRHRRGGQQRRDPCDRQCGAAQVSKH